MISYETLGTILIMSVTGCVIGLILYIIKPFVRNRLPKSTQYYLWLMALAVLVVPISRFIVLPDTAPNVPTISKTVNQFVVPNPDISERVKPYEVNNNDGILGIPESSDTYVDNFVTGTWAPEAIKWFRLILHFGAAVYLAFIFCAYVAFTKRIKRHNAAASNEEKAMLADLCGGRRAPILFRNPLAATPMLIGVFRPAIILPEKDYAEALLRSVLLHELTHLRRGDVLVKWLSVLITAVHWFNPVVWLVRREIDRACELSCDEAVTRNLDTDGKRNYGETLIYVAADTKTPHAVLSTTMCEQKRALKERLGAIMKSKKHTRPAVMLSVALIIVVGGTALALGAGNRIANDLDYLEIAALINSPQEEAYGRIGNPHETINGIDVFNINGNEIRINYDENNRVNQINYNGHVVVNAPDSANDGAMRDLPQTDAKLDATVLPQTASNLDAADIPQSASSLDDVIDIEIMSHNNGKYGGGGDFTAADHVTLKTVEEGNRVTAYIMAYYAEYSNDGGIHETAGSHIPAAITIDKTSFGLVEYWEAKEGSYYLPSIKEKFPSDIWDKADTQLYGREQREICLQKAETHYANLPPITAENSLYQAYYQVALKLYEMDEGINGDIEYIAVDMTGVSASEHEKLSNALASWINKTGYKPLIQTREELVKSGYIIAEPIEESDFREGILIEFTESSYKSNKLTVKASKYRGPLGAVGAEFTVRFEGGQWTVEEPNMVWMA